MTALWRLTGAVFMAAILCAMNHQDIEDRRQIEQEAKQHQTVRAK